MKDRYEVGASELRVFRVSFITALYNCLDYTKQYLDSLEETVKNVKGLEYEVILIDDCSTDGTRDFLTSLNHEHYKIILNDDNQGFARSNNCGASVARYELLAFLNNDLLLTPGWIDGILDVFKTQKEVGAVGNIQVNPRTGLIDHAGIFFDLLGRPAHARKNRLDFPRSDVQEWNAVTAACVFIDRNVFEEVDGYDTLYKNGCEDVDLCVKLRQRSYRVYVANKSIISHFVSTSPGRHDFNEENTKIFLSKWQEVTSIWGEREWPYEYLRRYARHWWRFNLGKFFLASYLIVRLRLCELLSK